MLCVPARSTRSTVLRCFTSLLGVTDPWKESREQALTDLVLLGGNAGRRVGWANVGSVTLQPDVAYYLIEQQARVRDGLKGEKVTRRDASVARGRARVFSSPA
jgi:hypothetical protein